MIPTPQNLEEQVVPALGYRQEFLDYYVGTGSSSHFSFSIFFYWSFLIPFIEHNDANRALMSSNMQRQAVPLLAPSNALLELGWKRQAALDLGALAIAEREGRVSFIPILTRFFSRVSRSLLDRHYRIAPLMRYEQEASRKLVFSELYEASKQTANPWAFEPEYPGKSRIFDGRTGNPFEQPNRKAFIF
ncbi:hypothetical protein HAX54_020968 [Datura stramonium]|uniref:DNA-directed RNA polymerase n=1 Tax=Datura stramonium TaxID=4076 RepID=A0ABS8URU9_DATST|nr:hypothetical protein [Datura stramonium]